MAMLSRTLRALSLRSSSHLSLGGRLVSTEPRPPTQLVEQKQRTDVEMIPAKELVNMTSNMTLLYVKEQDSGCTVLLF